MKCSDVEAIIDEHRIRSLGAADRTALDLHVAGCARCSAAWLTNEALGGERIAAARPGLFDATALRVLAAASAGTGIKTARRAPAWPMVLGLCTAGLAAAGLVAAFFVALPPLPPVAPAPPAASMPAHPARALVEGQDYRKLAERTPALPDLKPREVEVVELFAYDCLPCYSVERRRVERHALDDDRIVLVRVPVQWNERLAGYARAYYAAERLGKSEQMNLALYEAIHGRGDAPVSADALAEVFTRFGVDRLDFDLAFDSAEVRGNAQRAAALAEAYGVTAVPAFVVDGELVATSAATQSHDDLLDLVQQLAECVERKQDGARADRPC